MRNQNKNSGISPLKLALIITGSVIAAAAVIFLAIKLIKKFKEKKFLASCGCGYDCDCCDDEWEFDDDVLDDLRFDDEDEEESTPSDEISAAVDEAIEAIEAVADAE